jgi:hypothetical protein
VSEQNPAQTSSEPASLTVASAGPASPGLVEAVAAPVQPPVSQASEIESLVVDEKAEAPTSEALQLDAKVDSKVDTKPDALGFPEAQLDRRMRGKSRFPAIAAVAALATVAGALGGALAIAAGIHLASNEAARNENSALEASIARIEADILALKSSVEHTSKLGIAQVNRTSDRLDKLEKAQAEPAAKIAKLSEALDNLLATTAPAAAPVATAAAPKEVAGSIVPPASAPAASLKIEIAKPPKLEGWFLRDVAHGGALIEGRRGYYEVYAGDLVPGIGRVDAVRRQDGRWVVVTSKGLIVAR